LFGIVVKNCFLKYNLPLVLIIDFSLEV